jgi:tRNA dimethylallyltransferase
LTRLDPSAAARIHPNDIHKTIRALEIRMLTRSAIPASATAQPLAGYRILQIGLNPDREKLVQRLNSRVEAMFGQGVDGGLIDELRALLAAGATGSEKPFEALGYKQALQHVRGQATLQEAVLSTQIETRQYAKRQKTWFGRDPRIHWLDGFGDQPDILRQALRLLDAPTYLHGSSGGRMGSQFP